MARLKPFVFLLGALLLALAPLRADLLVKPHDVVLVAAETPMMQGWCSVDIAQYFLMCEPVEDVNVVCACDGEEEIEPFLHRVPTAIAFWKPTVALISHGVNQGRDDAQSADYTQYHPLYIGQTLDALKAIGVRTIVLGSTNPVDSTQFGASPDAAKTYNTNLGAFADLDQQLATKAGVTFADLFHPMMDAMTKAKAADGADYVFGGRDGRFPDRNAQFVMAYGFLKALGCDGAIGTITVDLAKNTATGTPGQKIVSVDQGAVTVESTRYPYCFQGDPKASDATSGIVAFFPFNAELNRYLLVVNGLTTARAKVTWGVESREFAAADLAKGVNLAEAFAAHTPFDPAFMHVQDQLWQQQLKQVVLTDTIVSNMDAYAKMAPGAPLDQLAQGIRDQDRKNGAKAAALFVPLRHTIKIEPLP
jgi:hypothetical protein